MRKWVLRGLIAVAVVFGLIQLVPYGRDHTNPPVTREVTWDSTRTRELAVGACYDCHSDLTVWPWYSKVAPVSWLVYGDVKYGREALNFSEWDRLQGDETSDIAEAVRDGSMPPLQYKPLHPAGRLTSAERQQLAQGMARTVRADPPITSGGG
jgi:mono/diheme cytochrome c family protein